MKKLKIKKQKQSWLSSLTRYYNEYELLKKECSTFNISLFKYFIYTIILGTYDTLRLEDNKKLLGLILIKKTVSENHLEIIYFLLHQSKDININILQNLKIAINNYNALGYSYIEASFKEYDTAYINFFKDHLGFIIAEEKSLINLINLGNNDIVTISKKLQ